MIRQDLVDYIKAQLQKGLSKDDINKTLLSAGWKAEDIAEAFKNSEQNIPISQESHSYQGGQGSQTVAILKSPTDLLKEAWGIYKTRFKTFLKILLVQYISVIVLVIAGAVYVVPSLVLKTESFGPAMNVLNWFLGIIVIIAMLFFMIITALWGQAAMLYAVKDSGENIGVKESYRRGRHKIGSIFWVGLLSGIIVSGGYLLFIIPGIIFSTWFSFAVIIVVAEGLGGMDAILKSKEYVKGHWWEVFWRFLFIGLVLFVINLVFLISSWIINFIAQIVNNSALINIGVIINFAGSIVGFLLAPLIVIYTYLVYKNIKEVKGDFAFTPSSGEKLKFIIVGLLGILLFIGLFAIPILLLSSNKGGANSKAMDYKRQYDIDEIRHVLDIYKIERDIYPTSLQLLATENSTISSSRESYLIIIPKDPKTDLPYEYWQLNGGKDYELCVKPENTERKCFNSKSSSNFTTK